jgi:hypothetical protein
VRVAMPTVRGRPRPEREGEDRPLFEISHVLVLLR